MARLIDSIFSIPEESNLDRSQVEAYIRSLDEIILQGLPLDKELALQKIKLKLLKRLNQLIQDLIPFNRPGK